MSWKIFENVGFIKIICSIVCTIGLLYHSSELIRQYVSGKTVVNLEVGRKPIDTIPGITICYPYSFSMERTAKLNTETEKLYQEYKAMIDKLAANYSKDQLNEIKNRILEKQESMNFELNFNFEDRSMVQFIDNYSLSSEMIMLRADRITGNNWFIENCTLSLSPIESIAYFRFGKAKCFNYFTMLQPQWRHFKVSLSNFYDQLIKVIATRVLRTLYPTNFEGNIVRQKLSKLRSHRQKLHRLRPHRLTSIGLGYISSLGLRLGSGGSSDIVYSSISRKKLIDIYIRAI